MTVRPDLGAAPDRTVAHGRRALRLAKAGVWALGLFPLALALHAALTDGLGANPIESLTHRTGFWALTLLLGTLAVSPLRRLTGWNLLIQLRRPLGLFAFFHATLHVAIYVVLDHALAVGRVAADIVERPFVTAGAGAYLLLIPLALTSTRGMIRRLGGRRWQRLHRLVYLAAALAVLHFVWLVKADLRIPVLFAAILLLLMLMRLPLGWPVARARRPAGS